MLSRYVALAAIRKPLWTTPDTPVTIKMTCRKLVFPFHLVDAVGGALSLLLKEELWEKVGTETVEDAVEYLDEMWLKMSESCEVIGEVKTHVLNVLPSNWLDCDGMTYLRTDYPDLYSVIDPALIIDADHFKTPRMWSRFVMGKGPMNNVNDTGGAGQVALTVNEMPSHNHSSHFYSTNIDLEGAGVPDPLSVGLPQIPSVTGSRGGGAPHENKPPFVILKFAMVAR